MTFSCLEKSYPFPETEGYFFMLDKNAGGGV